MGQFQGYQERDYGRSAIYAKKNLRIDASALPDGITVQWAGGDASPARVLAVYGNLTMKNVSIISGYVLGEAISAGTQPFTLARGAGLAVWGTARLQRCTVSANRAVGDEGAARDRGSFGGGIYANRLILTDTVVSGNSVKGYGAAGGGVYSVGGVSTSEGGSSLTRCAITGNRVTGQHAYGGGVYSDGGGPGNRKAIKLTNCTIARNLVEDHPGIGEPAGSQYYYRGGGFYMSNGSLVAAHCTIVQNAVTGHPAVFSNKPNMGGGGVAATIGNAHVVENMEVWHSIVAGNTVNQAAGDVYTGSLIEFMSYGYNLVGKLDFSQILVPIPPWMSLSRQHWPKDGDHSGVDVSQVLLLDEGVYHDTIHSLGTDAGGPAVLWFPPAGEAMNQIPSGWSDTSYVRAEYTFVESEPLGDFLNDVLQKIRDDYGNVLGSDFGSGFGDLSGMTFSAEPETWPADPANAPWIAFWRQLDAEIDGRLGPAGLADDFWRSLGDYQPDTSWSLWTRRTKSIGPDQRGHRRPSGGRGDIGAIEF